MKRTLACVFGIGLACVAMSAFAESYPSRPVRVIVPYAPGGTVDMVARKFAERLALELGQPFVVDNRAGASGVIGSEAVARSEPDGYTLLINAATFAINPMLMKSMPYDIHKDFTPVSNLGDVPFLITANPNIPANNLREFIQLIRADPKKYQFGVPVTGSGSHLAEEALKYEAKLDFDIIPYKGAGPALVDVIGGHLSAMVDTIPSSLPHVRSGKLKALAVTSASRVPSAPDIPTVAESGIPGFEMGSWVGLWGPAGMPASVTQKLYEAVRVAIDSPTMQTLADQGFIAIGSDPATFATFVRRENEKFSKIVEVANVKGN